MQLAIQSYIDELLSSEEKYFCCPKALIPVGHPVAGESDNWFVSVEPGGKYLLIDSRLRLNMRASGDNARAVATILCLVAAFSLPWILGKIEMIWFYLLLILLILFVPLACGYLFLRPYTRPLQEPWREVVLPEQFCQAIERVTKIYEQKQDRQANLQAVSKLVVGLGGIAAVVAGGHVAGKLVELVLDRGADKVREEFESRDK